MKIIFWMKKVKNQTQQLIYTNFQNELQPLGKNIKYKIDSFCFIPAVKNWLQYFLM